MSGDQVRDADFVFWRPLLSPFSIFSSKPNKKISDYCVSKVEWGMEEKEIHSLVFSICRKGRLCDLRCIVTMDEIQRDQPDYLFLGEPTFRAFNTLFNQNQVDLDHEIYPLMLDHLSKRTCQLSLKPFDRSRENVECTRIDLVECLSLFQFLDVPWWRNTRLFCDF